MTEKTPAKVLVALAPSDIRSGPNSLVLCYSDALIPDHNFEIRADRLCETNRGKVEGEISVVRQSGNGKLTALLVNQSFGFMSSSSKENLQRTLRYRIPDVDWTAIIDTTCWKTIQHVRTGEPEYVRKASDITLTRPGYLLYPLLPRNQPSIIFGKKGSCKTTLAMFLAIHAAAGWHDSPFFHGVSADKTITLWLDWETDKDGFDYDFKRISSSTPQAEIVYRRCRGSLAYQAERIKDLVSQYHAGLVVVDSIAPASGGNIKEAESAIAFHDALRYLGCTTLSLGHPPKGELTEKASVTGAGQYEDLARNVWEAQYEQNENEPTGHQILIHRKPYKTGYLPPIGLCYEFSEEGIIPVPENPKNVPQFLEKMTIATQIHQILKTEGPKTAEYLTEAIGSKKVPPKLTQLRKDGKVANKNGLWTIHFWDE